MPTDCIRLMVGQSPSQLMLTYGFRYSFFLLFISSSLFSYTLLLQTRVVLLVHVILKIYFVAAHIMGWKLKELIWLPALRFNIYIYIYTHTHTHTPTPTHIYIIFTEVQRQVIYLLDRAGGDFASDTGLDGILGFLFLVLVLDDTFSSSPTTWNKTEVTLLSNTDCAFYLSSYPKVTWLQTHI